MTKRLKIWLIVLLSALCTLFGVAGCIGRATLEELIKDYDGHVTYYGNGGYFNGSNAIVVKSIYFKCGEEGVPFYDIQTSGDVYIGMTGYDFVGWYLPETYKNGEHEGEPMYTYTPEGSSEEVPVYPVYDDNGEAVTDSTNRRPVFAREGVEEQILESKVRVVASDTQVTSEYIITHGTDIIVCAKWVKSLQMQYILVYEEGKVLTDAEGNEYRNGDVIKEELFLGSSMSPGTGTPLELNGGTFVRTYLDPECTEEPALIQRPDGYEPVKVYSKYIEGDWEIVTNDRSSVSAMFSGLYADDEGKSKSFYVYEDIDCSSMGRFTLNNDDQKYITCGKIEGNGHTISNITFNMDNSKIVPGRSYSIFGAVYDGAVISNLTIRNVTITMTSSKSDISVFAVLSSLSDKADIHGLVIENVKAELTVQGGMINNAPINNGVLDTSNWLFGGMGSDAAFLEKFGGENGENINISGDNTLTIK